MQLRPYQHEAIDAVYRYLREHDDNPCVVLPTGCHGASHPILMYDGTLKPVEEVTIGDQIMGPDSTPRHVLALCRGEDDLYRILPNKGESFIVNGDHVLSLVCTNEGKQRFDCYRRGGEIENVTVLGSLKKSRSWRHLRKLYRTAVEFSEARDLPIPPYILGLLLGDGCLRDTVDLTTADVEIEEAWIAYAATVGCEITVNDCGGRCPSFGLTGNKGRANPVMEMLTALGLSDLDSGTKFIPHEYLTASRHQRLELLAGLVDTDGSLSRIGFDYTTKSQELAADIVFLARSLGLAAYCTRKYSYCQTGSGGWFFRISISGDTTEVPTRLPRKRAPKRRQKKSVLRTGFHVEPVGRGPYFGFVLDGDHLYVDGHFVVHHNSGKTPVIATICRDAVTQWQGRVLILAHVKELLEQAADKLQAICPDVRFGIYSAGLRRRDTAHGVIVAGIHSIYKRACELDAFDLVIVDEAHMIPPEGEGMYRQFLAEAKQINPQLRVIGLTATPYRMKSGPICTPEHFLNAVCYEVGVRELIRDGYLCPLVTKAGRCRADTNGLHVRGGEYVAGEVEDLMDQDALVDAACAEIVEHTGDRKAVLIFAAGVKHGRHIVTTLAGKYGIECGFVCGETPDGERAETLNRFRGAGERGLIPREPLRYLCNVNVLTTGFDAPNIDCVAMLRPTLSPGLYYQMVGRGFRLHPGKTDCLILDFGGNVLRHGPVDQIVVGERAANGNEQAPAKECPQCHAVIAAGYAKCPECGYEFPPPERAKHDAQASDAGILSGQVATTRYAVADVYYSVHIKRDAQADDPTTMRVDYRVGWHQYKSEWVCFEHQGYARQKAIAWWRRRSPDPMPETTEQAVERASNGAVAPTLAIVVRSVAGEPYERIVDYELGPMPEPVPAESLAFYEEGRGDDIPF